MPRVGLSVSLPSLPTNSVDQGRLTWYLNAIRAGGAEPVTLFLDEWENRADEVAAELDGLVLSGGADLDPKWYHQDQIPEAGLEMVSDRRPTFEKQLLEKFVAARKPVLGICYGCQFMNVFHGGTLFQDLKYQLQDVIEHKDGALHEVDVTPDSFLYGIVKDTAFEVPSYHHQAVSVPAPNGKVVALSPDEVIEAMEWPGLGFHVGVQWHPERAPESAATRRLFAAFAAACAR